MCVQTLSDIRAKNISQSAWQPIYHRDMESLSKRGFSLVSLLVLLTGLGFALAATTSAFDLIRGNQLDANLKISLTQIRQNLFSLLSSDQTWQATVQRNPGAQALACFAQGS